MAITRTQIARQLLQFGGGADLGAGATGMGSGSSGFGAGRNGAVDTGDFGSQAMNEAATVAAEQALGSGRDDISQALNEAERIRNRRFAVERPTLGMTLADLARGSLAGRALTGLQGLIDRSRLKRSARFPGEDEMAKDRIAELIDQQRDESDGSQIVLPIIPKQEPIITEDEEEDPKGLEGLRLAFRADGGPIGGEYDFESARQMYGLGKLVKKVTRTVKKIAKSPVGKAALIYAGTAGLGALGAGKLGTGFKFFGPQSFLAPSNVLSNVGTSFLRFKGSPIGEKIFGTPLADDIKRSGGLLDKIGGKAGLGIIGVSALAGLLTPEQEDEAQALADNTGIDIEKARQSILRAGTRDDFRARAFRAEGGSMKEPVAKKTMPLLDLDGKEMDLRAEGGFVPIGRMEKADDVPAILSKNEFVFTADAVRNAGDGNVDKGAEVMYNMMKNLEAGGDVSEESQGLEGARRMFQTSKRLEEVL